MAEEKGRNGKRRAAEAPKKTPVPKKTSIKQSGGYQLVHTASEARKKSGKKRAGRKQPSTVGLIVFGFLAFMILSLIVNQIKISIHKSIRTQTAMMITISNTIETEGWTVRNETVLTTDKTGVIVPTVASGGKISKGEPVALIFQSADAANAYSRVSEIDGRIARFMSMETAKDDSSFANSVEKQMNNRLLSLSRAIYSKDTAEIDRYEDELLYLLNKEQIATQKVENFRDRIEQLEEEKLDLETSFPALPSEIPTSLSGYYIAGVDGYEDKLNRSLLAEMTPEAFKAITDQGKLSPGGSYVGKIADDYKWLIACLVSVEEGQELKLGKDYTLRLPYSNTSELTGRLVQKTEGNGTLVLIAFEISVTVPELLEVRSQPVTVVLEEYTGIGVPAEALHVARDVKSVSMTDAAGEEYEGSFEENTKGVFIKFGDAVRFRKIEIIHENEEVAVVRPNMGKGWLKLYDEIIVSGKDLYNGKIID